jgi:hypothetical protein
MPPSFFSLLRVLVLTFHVGDEWPLHPRPVFVPAASPLLLPAPVDFTARHYFKIGSTDADRIDRHYQLHHCGKDFEHGSQTASGAPLLLRDVYPAPSLEEHALFECALEWYRREEAGLARFDAVVFTHSDTFLDALSIAKRMRHLLRRSDSAWHAESMPDPAWGSRTRDFELVVPGRLLLARPHYPVNGNSMMMHAGYDDGGAVHRITEEEFGDGSGVEAWLERMRIHVDLKHGMSILHKPAASAAATSADFAPFLNMRTGSLLPRCVHPAAIILVYATEIEMRRAEQLQHSLRASFSCQHLVVMVDNAVPNGVTSSSTDVRLHTHSSLAEARMVGVRMAQSVAQARREKPYVAISFMDVARLRIDADVNGRGWVARVLDELFAIDKAVAIHPVLTANSDTRGDMLRGFPFLKTAMRSARHNYRAGLEAHECCQQVWILGGAVAAFWNVAWLDAHGWLDPGGGVASMHELEAAYFVRKDMHKLLVSEAAIVKRERESDVEIDEENRIALRAAAVRVAAVHAQNKIVAQQQEDAIACHILSDKYGRAETSWTDALFFGGSVAEEVDRLARAGGKSVLYKPSGSVLEVSFKTHEHPSINEVKDKWTQACADPLVSRHTATMAQVGALLSAVQGGAQGDDSGKKPALYFVEATLDAEADAHVFRAALLGMGCVVGVFLALWYLKASSSSGSGSGIERWKKKF